MKLRLFYTAAAAMLLFASCKKDETTTAAAFEAKVDGQLTKFNVGQATLVRDNGSNMKRLDIVGTSTDGSKRIIVTLAETPASGNSVHTGNYKFHLFNDDDPNTAQDESEDSEDGFVTISTSMGNNNWVTDVYAQTGQFTVTNCDANSRKISGTFNVQVRSLTGGANYTITEGRINNVNYQVMN
jgi:hypothetical protein